MSGLQYTKKSVHNSSHEILRISRYQPHKTLLMKKYSHYAYYTHIYYRIMQWSSKSVRNIIFPYLLAVFINFYYVSMRLMNGFISILIKMFVPNQILFRWYITDIMNKIYSIFKPNLITWFFLVFQYIRRNINMKSFTILFLFYLRSYAYK